MLCKTRLVIEESPTLLTGKSGSSRLEPFTDWLRVPSDKESRQVLKGRIPRPIVLESRDLKKGVPDLNFRHVETQLLEPMSVWQVGVAYSGLIATPAFVAMDQGRELGRVTELWEEAFLQMLEISLMLGDQLIEKCSHVSHLRKILHSMVHKPAVATVAVPQATIHTPCEALQPRMTAGVAAPAVTVPKMAPAAA
eukprot:CFRG8293T1